MCHRNGIANFLNVQASVTKAHINYRLNAWSLYERCTTPMQAPSSLFAALLNIFQVSARTTSLPAIGGANPIAEGLTDSDPTSTDCRALPR